MTIRGHPFVCPHPCGLENRKHEIAYGCRCLIGGGVDEMRIIWISTGTFIPPVF